MEKEGAKVVSIANSDGKTKLTAVLAVTSTGEYLAPQIYAKARQLYYVIHKLVFQTNEISGTLIGAGLMRRQWKGTSKIL